MSWILFIIIRVGVEAVITIVLKSECFYLLSCVKLFMQTIFWQPMKPPQRMRPLPPPPLRCPPQRGRLWSSLPLPSGSDSFALAEVTI